MKQWIKVDWWCDSMGEVLVLECPYCENTIFVYDRCEDCRHKIYTEE